MHRKIINEKSFVIDLNLCIYENEKQADSACLIIQNLLLRDVADVYFLFIAEAVLAVLSVFMLRNIFRSVGKK